MKLPSVSIFSHVPSNWLFKWLSGEPFFLTPLRRQRRLEKGALGFVSLIVSGGQ